jgi:glycosyltransferase involved in cell wall biosynthesis
MRILTVTDAWFPQVNGVVRTLDTVSAILRERGHEVDFLTPEGFRAIPCPGYPEIPLCLATASMAGRRIEAFGPDAIHIATEGPLGLAARRYCMRRGYRFTTSYHTRFPEYLHERLPVPGLREAAHRFLDRFHRKGEAIMVATPSIEEMLRRRGHTRIRRWSRGVDTELFRPRPRQNLNGERPISLYCGRVATEKNIEAFLDLELPGTKYVVGDGPQRAALERRYPNVEFTGYRTGEPLAALVASADVFVFPSRTDTFGLVLIEALACGVPVAAYPVPGPIDVVADESVGALDEDLGAAVSRALRLDRDACRAYAEQFTWERSAEQFLDNLVPTRVEAEVAPPAVVSRA